MSAKNVLKISAEVARYLVLNDLAKRYILTQEEAETGLRIIQRNHGSFKMTNGDFIEYQQKSWVIRRA
jgi:hypothetical protein